MQMKKVGMLSICLVIMLVTAMIVSACSQPAPAPSPKPSPKPASPATTAPSPKPAPTVTTAASPKASPSPAAKPPPAKAFEWPKPLIWTALDVGSAGYIIAAALADSFSREAGITLRIIPSGTDISRVTLLSSKRVMFAQLGGGAFYAQEGVEEFAATDKGPMATRFTIGSWNSHCMTATKVSNVKTLADVKGKKLAWVVGSPAVNANHTAYMAYANLTWKDVTKVEFPSFGAAGRGLIDGIADVLQANTTSAFNYELETSPRGLYFIPIPASDKEGWARLNKVVPFIAPRVITEGPGLSETKTYEGGSYPNPGLVCFADQDAELVYQQTKLMVDLYPKYSQLKAPGIGDFALKLQRFDWAVPFHDGAIRYYKEIGKWTDAAQKHNDRLLERQKVLRQAWDKAITEVAEKKVKADDFLKTWYPIRGQALKAAGFEPYWKAPDFVPWD